MTEPKILSKNDFSIIIEKLAAEMDVSHMDAIIWYCEEHEMEIEVAAKMINTILKEKIEQEAMDLNFLEKKGKLKW